MALAPTLGKHLGDVLRMQVHMHAPIRVVDVANLPIATNVDWVARKQRKAVLLETACRGAKFGRVLGGQAGEGGLECGKGAR